MYTYVYIHIHEYTCICICTYMYNCIYMYVNLYIYTYIYTCMHIHIHEYTYIYVYTYICIYMNIHTCRIWCPPHPHCKVKKDFHQSVLLKKIASKDGANSVKREIQQSEILRKVRNTCVCIHIHTIGMLASTSTLGSKVSKVSKVSNPRKSRVFSKNAFHKKKMESLIKKECNIRH